MISEFLPPGIKVIALRGGGLIVKGALYTVRGFVINRHWKTREPDPHVLFEEVRHPDGKFGEIGYPRDGFEVPGYPVAERELELVV
jgi:hypothetical protein